MIDIQKHEIKHKQTLLLQKQILKDLARDISRVREEKGIQWKEVDPDELYYMQTVSAAKMNSRPVSFEKLVEIAEKINEVTK